MVEARKYTVRPYKPARADLKDSFKVYLSATALHYHSLKSDDWCQLSSATGSTFLVQVWPATSNVQDTIIQTTETLRDLYNLKLGDNVSLSRCPKPIIPNADDIVVSECQDHGHQSLAQEDTACWAWLLDYELKRARMLCPGMTFTLHAIGEERAFRIKTINRSDDMTLYQSAPRPKVAIVSRAVDTSNASNNDAVAQPGNLVATALGGLDAQVAQLNSEIELYTSSASSYKIKSTHRPRSGAIVLYGPSGTGKSTLLRMIAEIGSWSKVYYIKDIIDSTPKDGRNAAIRKTFEDAHRYQPSLIIVDTLDVYAGKVELVNDLQSSGIVSSLCKGLDTRDDSRVLVVAAARNLALIDESLRYPGRFEIEIEIPVPGTEARAQILNLEFGSPRDSRDEQLLRLADSTHGYVGSDLRQLLNAAMKQAYWRLQASDNDKRTDALDNLDTEKWTFTEMFTMRDIQAALSQVRPTAMKEIFLDIPRVKWEDIGGQTEVKQALREAIKWPLKDGSVMAHKGLFPEKGLLLYGPPGCSKTLVAKAVAAEFGLNFIAVKGAEILRMYVGESERAVREIFHKARGAAPSIIFFDEFDALGASQAHSPQSGVQVLTTLLNELDGFEALKGVFVLAATNRPQILDPALLRPGRLESSLYVGLPDEQSRSEIIAIATRKMPLGPDFDAAELAKATEGYSGAELVKICQQAGRAAYREERETGLEQSFTMRHFNSALEKITKQVKPALIRGYEAWRDGEEV